MADAIDTSKEMVSKWERGEQVPSKYYQEKLCLLLEKTAQELGFLGESNQIASSYNSPDQKLPENNDLQGMLAQAVTQGIVGATQGSGSQDLNELRRKMLEQMIEFAVGSKFISQGHLSIPSMNPEEFLRGCEEGINACWSMLSKGEFWFIEKILPTYIPTLTFYAQQPSFYQRYAASLLSQAQQLMFELAIDQENFGTAREAGNNALFYAQLAVDPQLQVAASIRRGNLYFHREQPTLASKAYKQTLPWLKDVSPLLKGRVYAGLAEVLAMAENEQDALTYMNLAHEYYPENPEQDPAFRFTNFSRYSLYVFGEGQTRLFLNQPKEAQESFTYVEKQLLEPQSEPLVRVDLAYYQATSSMMLGNLEQSSLYVQTAAALARSVSSRLYYNKILNIYQAMKKKWKYESQVKDLEEFFQPW